MTPQRLDKIEKLIAKQIEDGANATRIEHLGSCRMAESKPTHIFVWGNNSKRSKLKGKKCRILVCGGRNSCLVEFADGEQVNTSRRALRKIVNG